jgi:hypothetical protein
MVEAIERAIHARGEWHARLEALGTRMAAPAVPQQQKKEGES